MLSIERKHALAVFFGMLSNGTQKRKGEPCPALLSLSLFSSGSFHHFTRLGIHPDLIVVQVPAVVGAATEVKEPDGGLSVGQQLAFDIEPAKGGVRFAVALL